MLSVANYNQLSTAWYGFTMEVIRLYGHEEEVAASDNSSVPLTYHKIIGVETDSEPVTVIPPNEVTPYATIDQSSVWLRVPRRLRPPIAEELTDIQVVELTVDKAFATRLIMFFDSVFKKQSHRLLSFGYESHHFARHMMRPSSSISRFAIDEAKEIVRSGRHLEDLRLPLGQQAVFGTQSNRRRTQVLQAHTSVVGLGEDNEHCLFIPRDQGQVVMTNLKTLFEVVRDEVAPVEVGAYVSNRRS